MKDFNDLPNKHYVILRRLTVRSFLIVYCNFFVLLTGNAQSDSVYQTLIAKAGLFHLQENYNSAIRTYEKAFLIQQPDALTAYKAAGTYSLASNAEKAFQYLQLALSTGWTEADWLSFDPYFDHLRTNHTEEWKAVEKQAFIKEKKHGQTLQFPSLRKEINLMTVNDQRLRYKRAQNKSESSLEIIDRQINQSDLNNLNRAKEIIKKFGWLKISQIGKDGQNNLWLIVQHADQDVQFQQQALQAMEKLKETKEINMENYAFLHDRIQCNLNYKQLYGTQVVWTSNGEASSFRPIIKEFMTDSLRETIGLQSLVIYALTYGFIYHKITAKESEQKDSVYNAHVRLLIDSAKYFYAQGEFQKTYDYYNTASTFLGGMTNTDNLDAAIIFSKIAAVNSNEKYRSIAFDFLELLALRKKLIKVQLTKQPVFKILYKEQRWLDLNKRLN